MFRPVPRPLAVPAPLQDVSLWKRLAEMSSEQGLVRQAIYCYSQARGG